MQKLLMAPAMLFIAATLFGFGGQETDSAASFQDVRALKIDALVFDVEIEGTRSQHVALQVENRPDHYTVYHEQRGGELEIWIEKRFSLFRGVNNARLILQVPRDVLLHVETATGAITVDRMSGERLVVDSSTGSVSLSEIAGAIHVETNTGPVMLDDCSGEFDIRTGTGSIELRRTTGDMTVRSSTGSQMYVEAIGDLRGASTTGGIRLEGIQGALRLETTTGAITGRRVALTGDSRFTSNTGRIELDLTNDVGDLEFDLSSSTGRLHAGGEEGQRQLFLAGSGFRIEGRTSTGSQRYF